MIMLKVNKGDIINTTASFTYVREEGNATCGYTKLETLPCKVTGIVNDVIYIDKNAMVDGHLYYEGKDITPDIFNDNGFEYYQVGDVDYWFRQDDNEDGTEKYNIEVEKYKGVYIINARYKGCITKSVKYVHELQQVLRIIELDDIANNLVAK